MQLLGIDFGKKKIGIAIGDTDASLAEPLRVIRYGGNIDEVVGKLVRIVEVEDIDRIVIGQSGGKVDKDAGEFGDELRAVTEVEIVYCDESFSTKEAQMKSMEAGIKQKKRKQMEDAYAATLILQSYLDSL